MRGFLATLVLAASAWGQGMTDVCKQMRELERIEEGAAKKLGAGPSCESLREGAIRTAKDNLRGCDKGDYLDAALPEKAAWCDQNRADLRNADSNYRQCVAQRKEVTAGLAKNKADMQKVCSNQGPSFAEQKRQEKAAYDKALQAARDQKAANDRAFHQTMNDLKAEHDHALGDGMGKAHRTLDSAQYAGGKTKDQIADVTGGQDESLDDMVRSAGGSCVQYDRPFFAKDDGVAPCGPKQYSVIFSCQIDPPQDASGCKYLFTGGHGPNCQGPVSCCVGARSRNLLMAASGGVDQENECWIRKCFCRQGEECTPSSRSCAIDEPQPGWPNLNHCQPIFGPGRDLGAPADALWTAAACRDYLHNVDQESARAYDAHERDARNRVDDEEAGADIRCPEPDHRPCGHADTFERVAKAVDRLRTSVQARVGIEQAKKRGCSTHLIQADLDASSISYWIRNGPVYAIRTFDPAKDNAGGPYATWSSVSEGKHIYRGDSFAHLCDALASYEQCVRQNP